MTFGEVLAVAAVAISGLTLWDSHQERVRSEAKAARSEARADAETATLVLRATPSRDGDRLALVPLNGAQAIQAQTILFPAALGLAPIETAGDPRIEADWFADGLKRALKAAGETAAAPGDRRLPIALVTYYVADGRRHEARAIHDLGYSLQDRFLRGSEVKLRGMSIVSAVAAGAMQERLDALWTRRHRAKR